MSEEIKNEVVEEKEHKCNCGNECKCGKKASVFKVVMT